MLTNLLPSGTVRNAAGTAVEFERISQSDRDTTFAQVNESPALKNRLSIKHTESGSGVNRRRRSVIRFDKDVTSTVDTTKTVTVSAYTVCDAPVGALTANTEIVGIVAYLSGFLASLGTSTLLYNGTGNGQVVLIQGSL